MALVNHVKKEVHAKIVYYGPEGVGKTTSLRYVYSRIRPHLRGELKTVPASGSSLLFFDFSPFEQPVFGGYRLRLHLYTLQGRVGNLAAWKMILKGIDGLMVVSDAAPEHLVRDQLCLTQLRDMVGSYGVGLDGLPTVLQLNKIELPGRIVAENAARELGLGACRTCTTSAVSGKGVLETLTTLSHLVMGRIADRDDLPRDRAGDALAGVAVPGITAIGVAARDEADGSLIQAAAPSESPGFTVVIADDGVRVEEGKVLIPLDIGTSVAGLQRFMVTVQIAPDGLR